MDYLNYKDRQLLSEAYNTILEKKKNSKEKKKDINKDGKIDKSDDYLANRRKVIAQAIAKKEGKKEDKKNFKDTLKEAYETLFESNFLNKKFARRYNKITSALLKAEPGSKEYNQLKIERDELVNILKDHGMTAKDLEKLLAKKENNTEENEEKSFSPNTNLQYPDSEDSDVKDLKFSVDNTEK
jgi:DNA-binding transcriptional MerR regulator